MKKSISLVAIVALLAVGTAFTTRSQAGDWWNITNPIPGRPAGPFFGTVDQVKNIYCPGVNNVVCAYLVSNPSVIVKRP